MGDRRLPPAEFSRCIPGWQAERSCPHAGSCDPCPLGPPRFSSPPKLPTRWPVADPCALHRCWSTWRIAYDVDVIVFRQPGARHSAGLIPARLARRITVLDLPANRRSFAARALRNAGRVVRSSAAARGSLRRIFRGRGRRGRRRPLRSGCDRAFLVRALPGAVVFGLQCARCSICTTWRACFTHVAPPPTAAPAPPPIVSPGRFGGTGARLAAALFSGARPLAGRCRTCPRHRAPGHGRGLPERTAAQCRGRRPATRSPSSSPATWVPSHPLARCASSGWKSGRGCATAGRSWCGGWWERILPPCSALPAAIPESKWLALYRTPFLNSPDRASR